MGIFSRTPRTTPVQSDPVLTREELTAITKAQQSGNPTDPGRGPVQSTTGRSETVIT